jgi:hypothetical protein
VSLSTVVTVAAKKQAKHRRRAKTTIEVTVMTPMGMTRRTPELATVFPTKAGPILARVTVQVGSIPVTLAVVTRVVAAEVARARLVVRVMARARDVVEAAAKVREKVAAIIR